ncbi:hypothetical protein CQW23_21691 [Capsicum baccatum]|uniref:Uncharacterized protein n=1 Tax=Capsicum baccatum TaxID=33114 RepID=A0A2G2VYS2_CAPBA|nr:hypothetical protein CQW23_21691 [Capsicum baccatum]
MQAGDALGQKAEKDYLTDVTKQVLQSSSPPKIVISTVKPQALNTTLATHSNFSSPYGTTNRPKSRPKKSGCSTPTRSATESFLLDKERMKAKSKDESLKKLEESLHNLTSKDNGQEHVNKNQQDKIKELKIQINLRTLLHGQLEKQLSERLTERKKLVLLCNRRLVTCDD